jgi:hypothetical protein
MMRMGHQRGNKFTQKRVVLAVIVALVLVTLYTWVVRPKLDRQHKVDAVVQSWAKLPRYASFIEHGLVTENFPKSWFRTREFVNTKMDVSAEDLKRWYHVSVPATLEEVRLVNEHTRQSVSNWIQRSDWEMVSDGGRSQYWYGLPPHAFTKINLPVGGYPIQHDLISYISTLLTTRIVYLEIGVSVGKGLYTQLNFLGHDSDVVALDIEDINPTLERMLEPTQSTAVVKRWDAKRQVGREGTVKQYRARDGKGARLTYVAGDEFDDETWVQLRRQTETSLKSKFNLILSDAMHSEEALVAEINQIIKHDLIDTTAPFAVLWDDCDGAMAETFWNVLGPRLDEYAGAKLTHSRVKVYGWLGVHEQGGRKHGTCISMSGSATDLVARANRLDHSFSLGIEKTAFGSVN